MADTTRTEDVKAIRVCAEQLKILSAKHYGSTGIEADRKRADRALAVADKLEAGL